MKIGIFGGSFNPPHKMHLNIALELIDKHYVDQVIFVPTGSKYKYKNNLISNKKRVEMLQILTNKNKKLFVSDYELKNEDVYTYQTLNYFRKMNCFDDIYFICGTDNLSYMDTWMNSKDILNNYKILIIKRDGEDIDKLLFKYNEYKNNIIIADIKEKNLSSTEIRKKIKKNEDVAEFLDLDVYKYIKDNDLYK